MKAIRKSIISQRKKKKKKNSSSSISSCPPSKSKILIHQEEQQDEKKEKDIEDTTTTTIAAEAAGAAAPNNDNESSSLIMLKQRMSTKSATSHASSSLPSVMSGTSSSIGWSTTTKSAGGGDNNTTGTGSSTLSFQSDGRRRSTIEDSFTITLPSSHPSSVKSNNLRLHNDEGLSIHKFNYDGVGLVGRERQVKILQDCVERTTSVAATATATATATASPPLHADDADVAVVTEQPINDNAKRTNNSSSFNEHQHPQQHPHQQQNRQRHQFILIHGDSGIGKTKLALSIEPFIRNQGGIFVSGNFNNNNSSTTNQQQQQEQEPYTGIAMVCRVMVGEILLLLRRQEQQEEQEQEQETIKEQSSTRLFKTNKKKKTFKFHRIQQELQSIFGPELQYLTHILPELWEILDIDNINIDSRKEKPNDNDDDNGIGIGSTVQQDNQSSQFLMTVQQGTQQHQHQRLVMAMNDEKNQGSLDAQYQQINYAFRIFLRVVCKYFPPLTIVLDDLQWADPASLQVIQHWISDRENEYPLIVIGSYRRCYHRPSQSSSSNNIDDANENGVPTRNNDKDDNDDNEEKNVQDDDFQTTLQRLKSTSHRDGFHIQELELENFTIMEVNQVLQALMILDDVDRTLDLAKLVHTRTRGNPYFCIEFITMLYQEDMITYNFGLMDWKWKTIDEISNCTSFTSNVVDILKSKMIRLPSSQQTLLQLASCLGSTFDIQILELIWEMHMEDNDDKVQQQPSTNNTFQELLDGIVQESFLERALVGDNNNNEKYSWVHDKVHTAGLSLIPIDIRREFQFGVGMYLYRSLNDDKNKIEGSIFMLVNLLNQYPTTIDVTMKLEIAHLNKLAAQSALVGSAFVSASKFATIGIQLLPEDKWEHHYGLTLELYSIGAEAAGIRGNIDDAKLYCDEVLEHGQTITDKLRVYYSFMDTLTNCNRAAEATEICLVVLAELGCPFPKRVSGRTWEAIKTILKLINQKYIPTQDEVTNLPLISDPTKAEVMKLLNMLTTQCYYTKNMLLFVVVFYKMFTWTLEYGIGDFSPQAFNGYGIIFSGIIGDFQGASRLGDYALQMHEHRLTTKATVSRTYQATYTFLLPWTKPLRSSLNPYLNGYKIGMQAGDTESAMWCLHFYIGALFVTGKSLVDIEAACRMYLPQMEELRRDVAFESTEILLQCILNFRGLSLDPFILTGEILNEDHWIQRARDTKNETNVNSLYLYKTWLYAYMGEHQLGAKLALEKGDKFVNETPGFFCCMPEAFCRAISLAVTARKTKKRKYRKAAIGVRKKIKLWLNKGNPNVIHYVTLLDAEDKAFKGKRVEAEQLYKKAISLATRNGFLHDAALANECYADFLLFDCKDKEEGIYHLRKAEECYREWGAMAKVEQLHEKYSELFDSTPRPLGSIGPLASIASHSSRD